MPPPVAFAVWSMRSSRPLLNLRLWANGAFSTALSVSFLGGGALFGGLVLVPLYFEIQRGQSTVHTGLLLISQGVGAALTMPLSGRLTDRFGGGVVSVAGLLITLAATLPLVTLGAHPSFLLVEAIFAVRGLGTGMAIMPSVSAAYSAIEPAQIPDATPQLNAVQRAGGSIGTAVLVVLVDWSLAAGIPPLPRSTRRSGGFPRSPRWPSCRPSCLPWSCAAGRPTQAREAVITRLSVSAGGPVGQPGYVLVPVLARQIGGSADSTHGITGIQVP